MVPDVNCFIPSCALCCANRYAHPAPLGLPRIAVKRSPSSARFRVAWFFTSHARISVTAPLFRSAWMTNCCVAVLVMAARTIRFSDLDGPGPAANH
jgi:hypothetical protein